MSAEFSAKNALYSLIVEKVLQVPDFQHRLFYFFLGTGFHVALDANKAGCSHRVAGENAQWCKHAAAS